MKALVFRIAILDGLLAVLIALAMIVFAAVSAVAVIPWAPVTVGLLALGSFAAWRGSSDARRVLRGEKDLRRPALEGLLTGISVTMLWALSGFVSVSLSFASGRTNADLDNSLSTWLNLALYVVAIPGGIGAWFGIIIGAANRATLRRAAI